MKEISPHRLPGNIPEYFVRNQEIGVEAPQKSHNYEAHIRLVNVCKDVTGSGHMFDWRKLGAHIEELPLFAVSQVEITEVPFRIVIF